MRGVVAVVAPDPADAGRAVGLGVAQGANELGVHRMAGVARLLARVDHELLPHAEARRVRARQSLGSASFAPSRLQTRMRSSVMSGRLEQASEAGQHRGDATALADRDDHERNAGVAAEERGAVANAVRGAVDAEQDRGPGDSRLVQQVDDGLVGGRPVGALLAADIDGQLVARATAGSATAEIRPVSIRARRA